jgi:hypothetical protein
LGSRGFCPLSKIIPKQQAEKLGAILERSYKGELPPIPINAWMKKPAEDKKLTNTKEITQNFPLTVKNT